MSLFAMPTTAPARAGAALLLSLLASGASAQEPAGELLCSRLTDDTWQVWTVDLDSGEGRQLTFSVVDKRYPGWTADGEVYYHTVNQDCWRIPEGTLGDPAAEHAPVLRKMWPVRDVAWAPDGSRIAFARIRTDVIDAANVWMVAPDETGRKMLTEEPGIQYTPSWSPDSKRIAFVSGDGWGSYEVFVANADGGGRRRLTENRRHEFLPSWSPDGTELAFVSDRTGDYEIWRMRADGEDPIRLTESGGLDTRPVWSPDGEWIAYTSVRSGKVQVWASRKDGSQSRMLVDSPGGARDVAWRRRPAPRPSAAGAALAISEVAVSRKTIDTSEDQETAVSFRTSGRARVSVDVVDEAGAVVTRLGGDGRPAGRHSLVWDGRDRNGERVPGGVYRYVVVAEDPSGRRVKHDRAGEPWGAALEPREFTLDYETGRMRWIMPKAGFARMRIAVQGFPLLATLMDWEPIEAGEQTLDWDGLDESGSLNMLAHPDLWVTLELFDMPGNTIIVQGREATDAELRRDGGGAYPPLLAPEGAHLEARKWRRDHRTPRLEVDFLGIDDLDPEGRPVLSGRVPVRIRVDEEDVRSMTDSLFEIALYVDLTFFYEEEESTTPLTYVWDTSDLPPGRHLLTVNVFSYDGRIGTLTRSVVIKGEE